jgi:membrane-bound metal-dependent hydrolase YbcI (DUF457 family)
MDLDKINFRMVWLWPFWKGLWILLGQILAGKSVAYNIVSIYVALLQSVAIHLYVGYIWTYTVVRTASCVMYVSGVSI